MGEPQQPIDSNQDFFEDITDSSGVFVLAREGLNTLRPAYIPLDLDIDARVLDSPESFRLHLAKVMTQSQQVLYLGVAFQTLVMVRSLYCPVAGLRDLSG